jgi:cytochrome c oxidase subunit 2
LRLMMLAVPFLAAGLAASEPVPAKSFDVVASRYKFEPALLEVTEGDLVEIKVKSADVEHGIGIKAFKVKQLVPKGGQVVTVRFVASKVGEYDVTCSEYCGKGHRSMKAKLVVKAKP